MKKKITPINLELRRKAEEQLSKGNLSFQTLYPKSDEDTQRLLYELQVRQIELELLDEELHGIKEETTRNRQFTALQNELYNTLPIAYCTISFANGKILQANLSAVRLLGLTREEIVGRYFAQMVAPESRAVISALFMKLLEQGQDGNCNAVLLRNGNDPFWARLEARVSNDGRFCYLAMFDITEYKQVNIDRFYQHYSAISKTTQAIILTDTVGHITWVNNGFTKLTGYSFDEVQGRKPGELLQGVQSDWKTILTMRNALRQQQGFEVEIINYTKSNNSYWTFIKADPLFSDDGVFVGFIAFQKDITKRKDAEARLRFQAELLNSISDAVIAADLQGSITYSNLGAEELYGWSQEELLGKLVTEVFPTNQHKEEAQKFFPGLTKGISWSGEFEVQKKDGTTFYAHGTVIPRRDENGTVTGIVGVTRNISEQKRSEEKLNFSNAELRAVLDSSVQVYFIFNSEKKILDFNKVAAQYVRNMLGKEILIGDDMMNYVIPNYIPKFEEHIRNSLHGELIQFERVLEFSDGRQEYFEFRFIPIPDSVGNTVSVAFSALNITEKRTIEQSLQQFEREREKLYHESEGDKEDKEDFTLPTALPKSAPPVLPASGTSSTEYITIPTLTQGNILLNAKKDIVYLKGAKDYTEIVTSSGKNYLCIGSIGSWEKRLFPQGFIRVHRSCIVNLETIFSWHNEGNVIILNMRDGEQITVSRGYREYFLSFVS